MVTFLSFGGQKKVEQDLQEIQDIKSVKLRKLKTETLRHKLLLSVNLRRQQRIFVKNA